MTELECNCYPGGFSPETYEGPQHHCPVHGHGNDLPVSECPQCAAGRQPHRLYTSEDLMFYERSHPWPEERPYEQTLSDGDGDLG